MVVEKNSVEEVLLVVGDGVGEKSGVELRVTLLLGVATGSGAE